MDVRGPVSEATVNLGVRAMDCFKAYDVRGELGVNFDAAIAYRIGRAVAQHFGTGTVVIGRDARETSPRLWRAAFVTRAQRSWTSAWPTLRKCTGP